MSIDEDGLLGGLRLDQATEPWNPPEYVDRTRFTEQEVTLGAVGGTMSLPIDARGAAVVLLSGGGPFDRDESSGPNKPLKDLAWGLAGQGIAVLRFDKITAAQPDLTGRVGFTMTEEYVPHALAAIELLREQPSVDRIYLAGHSMGGKVAPRIAAASKYVAGLILLAADTQPMHRAAVRVANHLATTDPSPGTAAFAELLAKQAEAVDNLNLSASTPASELPFGFSGSYWLDLREYDQVATAAALDLPMLILQGGRDYQVTVADDLAGWQNRLGHRADVTIRVLDADDHLFFSGTGPSTMADYATAQHLDHTVVEVISSWLQ